MMDTEARALARKVFKQATYGSEESELARHVISLSYENERLRGQLQGCLDARVMWAARAERATSEAEKLRQALEAIEKDPFGAPRIARASLKRGSALAEKEIAESTSFPLTRRTRATKGS
jgi:hypothetical protein